MSESSWRETTLGEVVRVTHGYAFRGEFFTNSGHHIVVTPGNFFENGGFKRTAGKEKWYSGGPVPPDYTLHGGDIIIPMTEQSAGLLGASAIVPESDRYLHNQRIGRLQIDRSVVRRFIYYLFNSTGVRQQIAATATGAKVRHTAPDRIHAVTVRLPSADSQLKIAAILSACDELIDNNRRRIGVLEETTRAIYQRWFAELHFPGSSRPGTAPDGWVIAPLSSTVSVLSGGTPKKSVKDYWGGSVPFFTPRDAPDGWFALSTLATLSESGSELGASPLFPARTIFITARGTVGKLAFAGVPMAMNQSCYAINGRNGYPQEFVLLFMKSAVAALRQNTGGATFDTIIRDTFDRISVRTPPLELAEAFSNVARPMLDAQLALTQQITSLQFQRDLLLPKLISGELDVSELDIDTSRVEEQEKLWRESTSV